MHVVFRLDIGGLEKVVVNCINRMPDEDYSHTVVSLTTASSDFSSLLNKPVNIVELNKREGNDWRLYSKFFTLLRNVKPDVLHTYNLATFELQFFSWLCAVPVRIHAEHGRDIFDPQGSNKKYKILRRILSRFIHRIVAVSKDLHDWLIKDVDLPVDKVKLIHNGIDVDFFSPTDKNEKKFTFGHVGRLAKIKNQKLMIEAFARACRQSDAFRAGANLIIVGEGECRKELEEVINSEGMSNNVSLAGASLDVRAFYNSFDVFVMSSLAEGIPMTLLEAMSSGVVPVVTEVGGIPEVVNEQCGFLYESEDKEALAGIMLKVFENRKVVIDKSKCARARIMDSFSEQAMVKEYISLYKEKK
ncbi:glycosyltransferase [Aestuariibacter salexigens]|uniref:glycosyltransferase n=1 Tax=Aestuariibacter salexigens TaxID=226010 RepID=UPI00146FB84E|nr:glycosyltransferase [Aestuariibacter salexigens]